MTNVVKLFPESQKSRQQEQAPVGTFPLRLDLLAEAFLYFRHMEQNESLAAQALGYLLEAPIGETHMNVSKTFADEALAVSGLEVLEFMRQGDDE